jgi:hypothetical protein
VVARNTRSVPTKDLFFRAIPGPWLGVGVARAPGPGSGLVESPFEPSAECYFRSVRWWPGF